MGQVKQSHLTPDMGKIVCSEAQDVQYVQQLNLLSSI